MNIIDCVQGTEAWAMARAGRVTASMVDCVLSRSRDRKSEGSVRANYKARVIAEILSGQPQEDEYTNHWMESGIENEPIARSAYELRIGAFVETVGFVVHPSIERSGCSPDGLVGTSGMAQFKCPRPAVHIGYALAGVVPPKYECQMQWEMTCCGRNFSDFVSYCPALPSPVNLFVKRLEWSPGEAQRIAAEITQFNREVDEIIEKLTGRPVEEYLERLGMSAAVF